MYSVVQKNKREADVRRYPGFPIYTEDTGSNHAITASHSLSILSIGHLFRFGKGPVSPEIMDFVYVMIGLLNMGIRRGASLFSLGGVAEDGRPPRRLAPLFL